ncbi:MAG: hypothetical protein KGL39_60555, partial [Patescibacteria group bacterium]|nr:hypothetical protein [Patescibacteria group bacterium]
SRGQVACPCWKGSRVIYTRMTPGTWETAGNTTNTATVQEEREPKLPKEGERLTLTEISNALQNPTDEAERVGASGALALYLEEHPSDEEALALYDKYHVLRRDWTAEVVSS